MENAWSSEDEEKAKSFAQKVVDRRMALPTILFLESLRPLHFIGGQFIHFVAPISGLVVSHWDLDRLGNFLEHRGAVPFVIEEIQRRDEKRLQEDKVRKRAAKAAKKPGTVNLSPQQASSENEASGPSDDSRHP